jgi:isopenicillin-N epimerase
MPTFGRAMLAHWHLDPADTYLNHGTVGAVPRRVLDRQHALREEMERHPARFVLRELGAELPSPWRSEGRYREAMRVVAPFVGARAEDTVFTQNVTTAMNAVLQSFPLTPGDEVLVTDLGYGAVTTTAKVAAARAGATVRTVTLPFPTITPAVAVEAITAALGPRTRLLVVDHITATTALVLPIGEIAAACRARGVAVAVDGAHAPGSIPVDVAAYGVDFYGANLHKWAHAPRAVGFLWVDPRHQAAIHAPVVSWGRDGGLIKEFEWDGTVDPTAALAAPEGVQLLEEWGREAVFGYMHDLAWAAGQHLARRWGTRIEQPRAMVGAMIAVPLPSAAGATDDDAVALRLALLVEDRIEIPVNAVQGRLWVRVSAQVYNDMTDVERLAAAVARRCGC